MDSDRIEELLQQAEKRLAKNEAGLPGTKVGSDITEPVQRPTAALPKESGGVRPVPEQQSAGIKAKESAGSNWFDLPRTVLTPEFKRDWQVLRMRSLLDPKHQKKALRPEAPNYSQVGRIVEGPADFFSARLSRKERRQTILGEVMRDYSKDKFHSKYANIQKKKSSGKKAFYQRVVAQRRKGGA